MKKTKIISLIIAAAISVSQASFAKDGLYVGADVSYNNLKVKQLPFDPTYSVTGKLHNENVAWGLSAGYKFNFDQVFIAPELFYDHLNSSANGTQTANIGSFTNSKFNFKNRYGLKVNVGYNVNDLVSLYVNAGLAEVKYSVKDSYYDDIGLYLGSAQNSVNATRFSPIYGAGFLVHLDRNVDLKTEYNYHQLRLGAGVKGSIQTVRLGVLYHF